MILCMQMYLLKMMFFFLFVKLCTHKDYMDGSNNKCGVPKKLVTLIKSFMKICKLRFCW